MWLGVFMLWVSGQATPPSQVSVPPSPPVTVMNTRHVQLIGPIGTCAAGGRVYNLHRLMILENHSVEVDGPHGPLRVNIAGQHVQIRKVDSKTNSIVYSENIADAADPKGDYDVELKLGYFDGMLVVYWKETYRHRIYHQGLFRLTGESFSQLCAGRGGVTVRD